MDYAVGKRIQFIFSGNVYVISEVTDDTVTFRRIDNPNDWCTETKSDLADHVRILNYEHETT